METAIDQSFSQAKLWREEAQALRKLLLDCGLEETLKWGKPCYTSGSGNIAIIQRMKDFLALMFFKGALLDDPHGMLRDQGPNSRSAKRLEFTSLDEIAAARNGIRSLVDAAKEAEKAGLRVKAPAEPSLPAELTDRFASDPALEKAFNALTPGRQRGYTLYIAGAKQASTRQARIGKHRDRILAGKGMHDR